MLIPPGEVSRGSSVARVADSSTTDVAELLGSVTSSLPSGGEVRSGQVEIAEAVARAMSERRHLVVQAGTGTGTGKSLAYLVPLAPSGQKAVVATARNEHLRGGRHGCVPVRAVTLSQNDQTGGK